MRKILLLFLLLNNLIFVNGQVVPYIDGRTVGLGGYAYQGTAFVGRSIKYHGELADTYDDDTYNREFFFREGRYRKIVFYINGIPITEKTYLRLKLSKRDLVVDDNYSTFDYFNDSTVRVNLHAKLSIPICIDGVEYNYQDTIPAEYLNGDKLYFRRERRFFRKDRIIVEKEHR